MTRDCTNCIHMVDGSEFQEVCGPCVFFTDGRPPTQWSPLTGPPPSAPFSDTSRLNWLLPMVALLEDPLGLGDARAAALGAALMLGKAGREAIDFAMEGSK